MYRYLFLAVVLLSLVASFAKASTPSPQETYTRYEGTLPDYTVSIGESREKTGAVTLAVTVESERMVLTQTLSGTEAPKGPVYCDNKVCEDQMQATGLVRLALDAVYTDRHLVSRILVN